MAVQGLSKPPVPSVPPMWFVHCVPHFERMLYDNAQLARAYLYAWQVTGNKFFRTIAEELRHSRDDGP